MFKNTKFIDVLLSASVITYLVATFFHDSRAVVPLTSCIVLLVFILWFNLKYKSNTLFNVFYISFFLGSLLYLLAFLKIAPLGYSMIFYIIGLVYFMLKVFPQFKRKKIKLPAVIFVLLFFGLNLIHAKYNIVLASKSALSNFSEFIVVSYGLVLVIFLNLSLFFFFSKRTKKTQCLVAFAIALVYGMTFLYLAYFDSNNYNMLNLIIGRILYLMSHFLFFRFLMINKTT